MRSLVMIAVLALARTAAAQEGDDLAAPDPSGTVPAPPSASSAPVHGLSPAAEEDVELLRAWLHAIAGQERFGRVFGGVGLIVAGALLAGFGVYFAIDPGVFSPDELTPVVIGSLGVLTGGMALVQGIGLLMRPTPNEQMAFDFDGDVAEGLDVRELGEYEGILRLNAEAEAYAAFLALFLGSGMILAGATCALAVALSNTVHDGARVYGYTLGATMAALGGLTIGLSRVEGPYESAYKRYMAGEDPDGQRVREVSVTALPFGLDGGGGVALFGSF
jgi:hypothetical protein